MSAPEKLENTRR